MGKLKILDVGSNVANVPQSIFGDELGECVRLDIDASHNPDYVHDITTPLPKELHEQFDIVFASHVLEHIERIKVIPTFQNLAQGVRYGGELWVIVPSLEWCAVELSKDEPHVAVQLLLYGGQQNPYDFHYCAFLLKDLRYMMKAAGLIPRKAYQSPFTIEYSTGETLWALQNIVIGLKHAGNPADSID